MKGKKLFLILMCVFMVAVLAAGVVGQVQARPIPRHPPVCYPIYFLKERYYGIYCLDAGNDIEAVKVDTDCPYSLVWDNTYVQLIAEVAQGAYVQWCVCDAAVACVEGGLSPGAID